MPKPIKISIPTPCHENWNAMTPEAKGRFCGSCQKSVFDFTTSSDREIASVLKSNKNTCGRFKASQLERELIAPKEKSSLWMATSAAVVSFLTIGNNVVSAQTRVNTIQTDLKTDDIIGDTIVISKPNRIINGVVKDFEGIVIAGANVMLSGSENSVLSDFDGKFSINVNKGDTLIVKFSSLLTKKIVITNQENYNIIMEDDNSLYENIEYVIFGGIVIRRTFFGRIFHSIGSIFR